MDAYDALALVGLVSFGVGLWLFSPPLSLTVVGALLIVVGLAGSYLRAGSRRTRKS